MSDISVSTLFASFVVSLLVFIALGSISAAIPPTPSMVERIYNYCLTFEDTSDCDGIRDFYNSLVILE